MTRALDGARSFEDISAAAGPLARPRSGCRRLVDVLTENVGDKTSVDDNVELSWGAAE